MLNELTLYMRIGEEGFTRLVRAFYAQVPDDDILGPMYSRSVQEHGQTIGDAERRLREFLIQRFGGPDRYSQERGHPRLRMRHAPFRIDARGAERWIALMERAMEETNIGEEHRAILRPYFRATAAHMVNTE
ncbi:MAG TPA: hemin transporter [Phycisphaerales bacterium]|nr:hemin transporter [Phycisphaerales bacterium]